jgi:hypothetical protein
MDAVVIVACYSISAYAVIGGGTEPDATVVVRYCILFYAVTV